ncbi:MAG: MFS transporter [Pleurocapsa minor GSE-CHR-MK-17-07R]|jgi:MFS family permease|nr:MFS transporter [Pleurocapsa minor GSE-CHR-MK 17-07R]
MFTRIAAPLRFAGFRWLALSSIFSLVGDMVYAIALPWLALQVTGSAVAAGGVLAVWALPRALFILFGGALSDRFSPKSVMLFSSLMSAVVNGLIVLLVAGGAMQAWMIYVAAALLGTVDALHVPAARSITPRTLPADHLASANGLLFLIFNSAMFLGPILGGVLSASSLALPFGLSAALSALAVLALIRLRVLPPEPADALLTSGQEAHAMPRNMLRAIWEGIVYAWKTPALRGMMILLAGYNLLISGPYAVGAGLLAQERFGGPEWFGAIYAAYGIGGVSGALLASALPGSLNLRWMIIGTTVLIGVGTVIIGMLSQVWIVLALIFVMGVSGGLYEPRLTTWLQEVPPEGMRGRVMGTVSFLAVGIEPLSHTLAGWLGAWSVTGLFVLTGALLTLLAVWFLFSRSARQVGQKAAPRLTGMPLTRDRLPTDAV